MKKTILFTGLAFAASACLLMGDVCYHPEHVQTSGTEDIINLVPDEVKVSAGIERETKATDSLLINGNSVETTKFILGSTVIAYFQNLANTFGAASTGGYVTGIELKYGINVNSNPDSLVLYIRPMYLTKGDNVPNRTKAYYYHSNTNDENSTNIYYKLGYNGSISPDNSGQNYSDAYNYRSLITIIHNSTDTRQKYIPGSDDTTLIFPFQEIDSLLAANPPDTNLVLVSSGRDVYVESGTTKTVSLRHELLLVPPPLTLEYWNSLNNQYKSLPKFPSGIYADLANMCPPQCPPASETGVIYFLK